MNRPAGRFVVVILMLLAAGWTPAQAQGRAPACEWCGTAEAPETLSWSATIAGPDEPGERLILTGTVTHPDGAPAADVLIYAYHTNAAGVYPTRGDETGNGRRHGYLRGWVRTDAQGRYRFVTIRPGTYPTRTEPAHIHMTIQPPEREEYWIDAVKFAGDPLLTDDDRASSGLVEAVRDRNGPWRVTRNIQLRE